MQINPETITWDVSPTPPAVPPVAPTAQTSPGGVIIPSAPPKPPAPPSGYQPAPGGGLTYIPGGPADPNAPKPSDNKPTEAQQKTFALLTRIAGGASDIQRTLGEDPEAQQAGLFETLSGTIFGDGKLTRAIAGENRRIITDTQADIIDALLTLSTGAAYTEEQLAAQRAAYLPQYGDTAKETQIKNARLQRLIESARIQTGPLAQEFDRSIKPMFAATNGAVPTSIAPVKAGQLFQTEADIAAQRQLQDAWDRGLSVDSILELNRQLGRGDLSPENVERLRKARTEKKPIQFYADPTGQPSVTQEVLGQVLETTPGQMAAGYFGGAANALTGGYGMAPETKEYLRETAPGSSLLGEITGGALATIPATRAMQGLLAGTRFAAAAPLLGETAYGAIYGSGEAGEGNRLLGALTGGGTALAGGALANRFMPGGAGTFTGAPRVPSANVGRFAGRQVSPEDIIAAGQQANIPVMTSDVMPPQTRVGKLVQLAGEIMPLGTAGLRREQQVARQDAVENLLADFGVTLDRDIAGEVVSNLNQSRADTLNRYVDMKQNVINKFAGRGSLPSGNVPAVKSTAAIDDLLVNLRAENLPQQLGPLIRQLEDVRNSLAQPGDLGKIEANRKTLFTLKGDPNLASISDKSEKAFETVYRALNDDMGEFIKAKGTAADFNLWKVANTKLARMADALRVGGLRGVLDKGEFDPTLVTKMLTGSKPADVRTLFTNLNKSGRENARLLLIQDAAKRAMNKETEDIDPNKFTRAVADMSQNFGQFFSGSDLRRVKGLAEVLRATSRAQAARFLPESGAQLTPLTVMGSFGGLGTLLGLSVPQGMATSAAFGAARRFYESKPARDLLLRISQASDTKKAELIRQFMAGAVSTTAAIGATRPINGQEPTGPVVVTP